MSVLKSNQSSLQLVKWVFKWDAIRWDDELT